MSINSTIVKARFLDDGHQVVPVSGTSPWVTVIGAGGPASTDNGGTITNPETHIDGETRYAFRRERGQGTTLRLRLGRNQDLTVATAPEVKVFGRCVVADQQGAVEALDDWMLLRNKAGSVSATLDTDAEDAEGDSLKFTSPHLTNNAWDCEGCNDFRVGLPTALTGDGTLSDSIIQAKFL